MFFVLGCTAPGTTTPKNKEPTAGNQPAVGSVAVGISPKIIYASRGGNISFTVDLLSTENTDDSIAVNISGTWINKTFIQDIKSGASSSIPVHITVPLNAVNMSFTVRATSHNLNATASTTGLILIK